MNEPMIGVKSAEEWHGILQNAVFHKPPAWDRKAAIAVIEAVLKSERIAGLRAAVEIVNAERVNCQCGGDLRCVRSLIETHADAVERGQA